MLLNNSYNPDVLSCLANLSSDEVFTPPALANEMLDLLPAELWSNKDAKFLDPVCKSGVFLREIAKRLLKGLEKEIPDLQKRIDHIFHNQLYGIAITELTGMMSRRSVYCSKHANGKYSITAFDNEQGNIIFERTDHKWKNKKCEFCGASQGEYDRSGDLETHAYQLIHTNEPEKIFNMKFDVIIGNPPYQLGTGGSGVQATPLYNRFVERSREMSPRFLTMIVPARWFSGGFGLDAFRDGMLRDNRLRIIHDYPEAADVFPGVQIKGGVCYFLWDRDNSGLCSVTTHRNDSRGLTVARPLLEKGLEFFVRYNEAVEILHKVRRSEDRSFEALVSSQKPFDLATTFRGARNPSRTSLKVYQNGGIGYIDRESIEKNTHLIDVYKVLIPRAGSGSDKFPHAILGKPFIGEPGSVCSETYLAIGPLKNEAECRNVISYIRTRFFRFLVMLRKPTQDALRKVYSLVPTKDFSKPWTDEELFREYGLTEQEVLFIESMVRPADADLFN
ncbi:MAG: Eco57I restriction-modification methylase domain-containing protein [Acidobacteria bacterium]|nr:Eco57I restriction-modification methylase domain-containing protein [Acidobacteriota bacterium]